jgi:hypothetical protein
MKRLIACLLGVLVLATSLAFTGTALADQQGAQSGKGYTSGNGGKNSHNAAPVKGYTANGGQDSGASRGSGDNRGSGSGRGSGNNRGYGNGGGPGDGRGSHDGYGPNNGRGQYYDHGNGNRHGYGNGNRHGYGSGHRPPGYYPYSRYGHAHYYYPPRGYVTPWLPSSYYTVNYGASRYYYGGGAWYRPYGSYFTVIAPPIGLTIGFLPSVYTTYWYGGYPYYYANSVYYTRRPDYGDYMVTTPPSGVPDRVEESVTSDGQDFFMYPREGQSEEEQARDRYECHRWSVDETGFDPSQPSSGGSSDDLAARRSDYVRAITACLDARGYTVR